MKRVIIFGTKDLAELAHFYLTTDSDFEVSGFSVHKDFFPENPVFHRLPVVEFEKVEKAFPPKEFLFLAPLTHRGMNKPRERVYNEILSRGYRMISYISSKATVFDRNRIGDNCFILEDNTIQPFVKIGSNVVLWSGNHVGHHSKISDHTFVTSHVVISGNCQVGTGCFLGVNSSLKENLKLGERTFIAMGSVITSDTQPYGVYSGNPAKKYNMSSLDLRY